MRKSYTAQRKAKIVQEILREEKSLSELSTQYGIHITQLRKWKQIALEGLPSLFERSKKEKAVERKREEERENLYAEIGRLTTQLNWLKKKGGFDIE